MRGDIRWLRKINGYWDLGRVRVPAFPMFTVMRDRGDSVWKVLSRDGDTLDVSETLPMGIARFEIREFDEEEGPLMLTSFGPIKLFLNGGSLEYELQDPNEVGTIGPNSRYTPNVYLRNGYQRRLGVVVPPDVPGDPLTYDFFDLN